MLLTVFLLVVCSCKQAMSTEFFHIYASLWSGRLYKPWAAAPRVVLLAGYTFMFMSPCTLSICFISLKQTSFFNLPKRHFVVVMKVVKTAIVVRLQRKTYSI